MAIKTVNATKLDAALGATADAIRGKTGDADEIAFDLDGMTGFAEAVEAIPEGADPVIEALSVTENGVYTAPSGVDGYSPVTVNVQGGTEPVISPLTVTENGVYTAPEGTDGYSPVTVSVPAEEVYGLIYKDFDPVSGKPSIIDATKLMTPGSMPTRIYYAGLFYTSATDVGGMNSDVVEIFMADDWDGPSTNTFGNCQSLKYLHYNPRSCKYPAGVQCFTECHELKAFAFKSTNIDNAIGNTAFKNAANLETVVILDENNVSLGTTVFDGTKIASGNGYVYVPGTKAAWFKSATNWSAFSARIKSHSEIPTYSAASSYIWDDFVTVSSKIYRCVSKTAVTGYDPSGTTSDTDYWQYCGEVK